MEELESLSNEFKLLDNFLSRRNQSGIKKSMIKILENPIRTKFTYKVLSCRSNVVSELKQSLAQLVSAYQNDQISVDLVVKCKRLAKALYGRIQIGVLTPVCFLCHNPCDPYSKKVQCCGYFAHIPCLEQISTPQNSFNCPKCTRANTLIIDVVCQNCKKSISPEKTMVSACRHIVCVDCVNSAQPLVPSPLCFCCPYRLPFYSGFKIESVEVNLYKLFSKCPNCDFATRGNLKSPGTCSKCKKNFCLLCKSRGHRGWSCIEYQM